MFADAKIAMLEALELKDIEALPPAKRRKLATLCRHWADLAEPGSRGRQPASTRPIAMTGVLLDLSRGLRSEE
jgi:hypothetical protein